MARADISINTSVTFRHTDSTPALKSYAEEKVTHSLKKYLSHNADVHIILLVEKRDHIAEVVVRSKGFDMTAKASTADLYSAIDKVIDNLETQARRSKDRKSSHRHEVIREAVAETT